MTSTLLVKLGRDLRAVARPMTLAAAATTVCLVVFGAIVVAAPVVDREFDRSYLSTRPADATLVLRDGVPDARAGALTATVTGTPGVSETAARTQLTGRLQVGGHWSSIPIQIFAAAPGDPGRVAGIGLDDTSWPPAPGEILLERNAVPLLEASVGDQVIVQAGGAPAALRVAGVAHDPSLPAAQQEQKVYAYTSTETLPALGRAGSLDEIKIITNAGQDRGAITTIARAAAERLRAAGNPVEEIQVPDPGRHPHRNWLDLVLTVLVGFGGTTVLLTGLVTATMTSRLLAGQVRQIGVMKALGARSSRLVGYYLAMSLTVAAAATAVATPLAVALGTLLARTLLATYDMDAASKGGPWWRYPAVIGVGLLLGPLLALVPVLRHCRAPVRITLDQQGGSTSRSSARRPAQLLDAALGRVPLPPAQALGVRSSARRSGRFALLVGQLALAGGLFLGGTGTLTALAAFEDTAVQQQRWDLEVDLQQPVPAAAISRAVAAVPGIAGAETWTVLPFVPATAEGGVPVTDTYPDQGHGVRLVAGVPTPTTMLDITLAAGRWLKPDDTDAVVLDRHFAEATPGAGSGQTIRLQINHHITAWRVVGVVDQKFGGPQAFVSGAALAAAVDQPGRANRVQVRTTDHAPVAQAAAAEQVSEALDQAGLPVRLAFPVGRLAAAINGHVYAAAYALILTAALIAIAGGTSLASAISSSVLERTREFAVMRVIGASLHALRGIVVVEGLVIGILGLVLGLAAGVGVTAALGALLGTLIDGHALPFQWSATATLGWTAAVLVISTLAALPATNQITRMTTRDALAHDQ